MGREEMFRDDFGNMMQMGRGVGLQVSCVRGDFWFGIRRVLAWGIEDGQEDGNDVVLVFVNGKIRIILYEYDMEHVMEMEPHGLDIRVK